MRVHMLLAVVWCAVVLQTCGCGGGVIPTPTPTPLPACVPARSFAYVLNGFTANTVSMFAVNTCTGALTPTTPATVPTGVQPADMVVDPRGRFLYVANVVSNASDEATISMFTIDATTGALKPTTPPSVATGFLPQGIGIDPAGKFVYTANSDDNTVSMFVIDPASGVLTPTVPSKVATGGSPLSVTVHPSGKFAYVSNQDDDTVSMYTINPNTGVLTPMSPATVPTGTSPFQLTVDPTGRFAYVPNAYSPNNTVSQYTIDAASGALIPSTTSEVTVGDQPTAVAVDPSGKFAYVVNRADNSVSVFKIDPNTGNLTPNGGIVATGVQPFRIVADAAGKFAFVVNEDAGVSVFEINSNGTLTAEGITFAGSTPVSITITGSAP